MRSYCDVCNWELSLDEGYDIGAVHRGMEMLGIPLICNGINLKKKARKSHENYFSKIVPCALREP